MITRGIETVSKGMQALIDYEDVTAHNLANVTTSGFKRSTITFQDIMQSHVNVKTPQGGTKDIGSLSIGSRADRTYIDFSQGGLQETGYKLDVAFQGDGFFKIRHKSVKDSDPYDERNYYYQRTGQFALTDENWLINKEGDYVMDMKDRRIRITRDPNTDDINEMNRLDIEKDLMIGENGQIELCNSQYRATLQKIKIVDFDDKTKISCIGQAKYRPIYGQDAGLHVKKDGTFSLQQGMMEMSNVSTITEMLNTINVSRGYESMSTILKQESEALQNAITVANLKQ